MQVHCVAHYSKAKPGLLRAGVPISAGACYLPVITGSPAPFFTALKSGRRSGQGPVIPLQNLARTHNGDLSAIV